MNFKLLLIILGSIIAMAIVNVIYQVNLNTGIEIKKDIQIRSGIIDNYYGN